MEVVARIPGLEELCMHDMEGVSLGDLMPLVACKQLTQIDFDTALNAEGHDIQLDVQNQPWGCRPSNVWRQLPACLTRKAILLCRDEWFDRPILLQQVRP